MATLVTREEAREENRRVLKILIGVMIALATVAFVTIILKH
ncbi:MAG TPA: hypothetical protein VMA09_06875 [Candidatus Binataceae bacterium]|nr:hypothetical protein [Candidatus Binataceae bacterium]